MKIDKRLDKLKKEIKRHKTLFITQPFSRDVIRMAMSSIFMHYGNQKYNEIIDEYGLELLGISKKQRS